MISRFWEHNYTWNYKATKELAEIKKGKVDEEDKFTEEVERSATAQCSPPTSSLFGYGDLLDI